MSKKNIFVLGLTFVLTLASTVWAAPGKIDYQGYLEDGGEAATDTLDMKFFIHRTSGTAGDSVWSESQTGVIVLGGLFNVTLGSSTTIHDTVFNGDSRYLQIEVDGTALSPRTQIVSSAYSMRVTTIDGADGGTIDGTVIAPYGDYDSLNIDDDLDVGGTVEAAKGTFGVDNYNSGWYAFVAGEGCSATGGNSTVAGKNDTAAGAYSVVGGGLENTAAYSYCTVGGGYDNKADNSGSTIAGGIHNTAEYGGTVAGGEDNDATGGKSFIGGGYKNVASGGVSIVIGGRWCNAVGGLSLAAGESAKANHDGAIVLAANHNGDQADSIRSGGNEQFVIRADGGIYLTNTAELAPYDNTKLITTRGGAYLSGTGGTWTNSCDRNRKENFTPINGAEIIGKVAALPITRWNYKTDGSDIEHIGPVSQDFHAAFGLGDSDKAIATVDADGVALVAIQELYRITQELQEKTARLDAVEVELAGLQAQVQVLLAERKNPAASGKTLTVVNDQSK